MDFHVIIPARFQSSRLPGKPLADIAGKSMIQRVYEQAKASGAQSVAIATDDKRIQEHVESFSGTVTLTRDDHESGTDRIREACEKLSLDDDAVVVNVQGDEPFIPPQTIRQVAKLLAKPDSVMSTLCVPIDEDSDIQNPNIVKVVKTLSNRAIYFSRSGIPFNRDGQAFDGLPYFRHLGIYGFKFHFLKTFSDLPVSQLESCEKLEQLRALENGYPIEIEVAIESPPAGVDTEKDLLMAIEYAQAQKS
ncbi:3-deoxy-manno-octulosonate cytidylyltransferase [Pleionea sediminis]|uniref:3-deoxy-manno-octulosonate cytidylyltransferase n=1 Tax=Pleionea sediminis TaxID=2569479 RepID=UPI00118660DC|nr:3-deoxy-manno-octulosonate cytidylyltransferase [Pleionea sediminis]